MSDRTAIEWTRNPDGTPGATGTPDTEWTPVPPGCTLSEARLVELRAEGYRQAKAMPFVDPQVLARAMTVLDRRGEAWAAAVLGRDLARRSATVVNRPYLRSGEGHTLVVADQAEDGRILEDLANHGH